MRSEFVDRCLSGRLGVLGLALALWLLPSTWNLAEASGVVPSPCLSYLQAISDHGARLEDRDRQVFKEVVEAKPADFKAEKLIDFLGRGLGLSRLFEMDSGVKEKVTVGAHTKEVLELFDKQFDHWKLDDLAKHLGITPERLRALLRTTVALHDVGKGLAVEAGNKDAQHEYTTPLLVEALRQLKFTDTEIQLAKALVDQDNIGLLLQQKQSLPQAIAGLKAAAKKSGIPEEDFFRLASAMFASDAGSYELLRGFYFGGAKHAELGHVWAVPDAYAYHQLAKAFKLTVPDSPKLKAEKEAREKKRTQPGMTPAWQSTLAKGELTDQLAKLVSDKRLVPIVNEQMEAALAERAAALRELKDIRKKAIGITTPETALAKAREVDEALKTNQAYLDAMAKHDAATQRIVELANAHLPESLKLDGTSVESLRFTLNRYLSFDGFVPKTAAELLALDTKQVPDVIHRFDDFPESPYASNNYAWRKAHLAGDTLHPNNENGTTSPSNHSGANSVAEVRNDSPFISFSGNADAIGRFGHPGGTHVKLKLRELLRDVAAGKVTGVDFLTREDLRKIATDTAIRKMQEKKVPQRVQEEIMAELARLAELSKTKALEESDFTDLNKMLPDNLLVNKKAPPYLQAVRHALAADEVLVRGKVPKKYLELSTIPER